MWRFPRLGRFYGTTTPCPPTVFDAINLIIENQIVKPNPFKYTVFYMEKEILQNGKKLVQVIGSFLIETKKRQQTPLIAIIGPTASGKTGLGIAIARKFNCEIISADSRQIYKEMTIATAKPTPREQKQAKHYLIDFVSPDREYNLSQFKKDAQEKIEQIHQSGKVPILVGGTGLYVSAVTENYELPESSPDPKLRRKYENLAKKKGKEAVHKELQKTAPEAAAGIHPNNLRYVIRALETANQKKSKGQPLYETLFLYIDWPREELYRRIEGRIDIQMEEGMQKETKRLLEKYDKDLPSMSSLGYKEIGGYLRGEMSQEEAVELFKKNTRNYAKRQITWFRKFPKVYSIPGEKLTEVIETLKK